MQCVIHLFHYKYTNLITPPWLLWLWLLNWIVTLLKLVFAWRFVLLGHIRLRSVHTLTVPVLLRWISKSYSESSKVVVATGPCSCHCGFGSKLCSLLQVLTHSTVCSPVKQKHLRYILERNVRTQSPNTVPTRRNCLKTLCHTNQSSFNQPLEVHEGRRAVRPQSPSCWAVVVSPFVPGGDKGDYTSIQGGPTDPHVWDHICVHLK